MKKATVVFATLVAFGVAGFYIADAGQLVACDKEAASAATASAEKADAKTAGTSSCSKSATAALAGAGSCSKSATAVTAGASCEDVCRGIAASVTAGKADCCKAAVSAVMASWNGIETAGTKASCTASATTASVKTAQSGCSQSAAASTQTAGSSGCSKSAAASVETAGASGCSKSASTVTAGSDCGNFGAAAAAVASDKPDCCKATIDAFTTAVYNSCTASTMQTAGVSDAGTSAAAMYASSNSADDFGVVAGGGSCNKTATKTAGSSYACSKSASTETAKLASIEAKAGSKVVLTGSAVCGSCDIQVSESCATVFKTADGKYYMLLDSKKAQELKKAKSEKGFEVVTKVRELDDGEKYLEVQSYSEIES